MHHAHRMDTGSTRRQGRWSLLPALLGLLVLTLGAGLAQGSSITAKEDKAAKNGSSEPAGSWLASEAVALRDRARQGFDRIEGLLQDTADEVASSATVERMRYELDQYEREGIMRRALTKLELQEFGRLGQGAHWVEVKDASKAKAMKDEARQLVDRLVIGPEAEGKQARPQQHPQSR